MMAMIRSNNGVLFLHSAVEKFDKAIGKANNERGRRALIRCDRRHGTITIRVEILLKY